MKKIKNIVLEQRFTRIVFGVIMTGSAFIPGGSGLRYSKEKDKNEHSRHS